MLANNETSVIDEICESRAIRMLVDIRTEFSIITRWLDGGNGQRLRFLRGNFPFLVDLDPLLDLLRYFLIIEEMVSPLSSDVLTSAAASLTFNSSTKARSRLSCRICSSASRLTKSRGVAQAKMRGF
jgi:hypothetical protein